MKLKVEISMNKSLNEKFELYQQEIPFRITLNLAQMYWSEQWNHKLLKIGLLIIKPEAIMLGKVSNILHIILENDFELIYSSHKKLTTEQTSAMWKYGWKTASVERILINQKLFSICNSIILIFRYKKSSKFSACEILTDLKGPSLPEMRKSYQIRNQIQPINYILNYIHTSDEITDFLRELGILFDWNELIHIFNLVDSYNTIPFTYIEQEPLEEKQYSLSSWVKTINLRIEKSSAVIPNKAYIHNLLFKIENDPNYKISLKILQILCQHNLIIWDFETIVILSSHIEYMN